MLSSKNNDVLRLATCAVARLSQIRARHRIVLGDGYYCCDDRFRCNDLFDLISVGKAVGGKMGMMKPAKVIR